MKSKFVTLYHLFKIYDSIKTIKFGLGHLESDYVADDLVVSKRFQGLISALGRVDTGYLEGYIEDEVATILGYPPSMSEAALIMYFGSWAKKEGFQGQSAEEIEARADLTQEQRTWIESYIAQWRKAIFPAS